MLKGDSLISTINAGFVTVLVGFTSSVVLVFQAAHSLSANSEQIGSWILALCLGMGVLGIVLTLKYKEPIVLAWSTSGAAIIIGSTGINLAEGVGAFIVCGVLIALSGFSGWFEKINNYIPPAISSSMLAAILFKFCADAFIAVKLNPLLIALMLVSYLLGRRFFPRYSISVMLILGIAIASFQGLFDFQKVSLSFATPIFVQPEFSLHAIVTLAIPLFIVTIVSQNIPGLAVLRSEGYKSSSHMLVGWTGAVTTLLAPLGCYALNLATITAAICSGKEAHPDQSQRYIAAVFAGVFYIVVGLFGTTIGYLLLAFPNELVITLAGFALLGMFGNALTAALKFPDYREAAILTFCITISNINLFGMSSVLWGLVIGLIASHIFKK